MSNDSHTPAAPAADDQTAVLFIQMVFQLSSLATMLLGKAPHPDTGKSMRDLEAARVVIDQLDMLERKTKGNLSKAEEQLLRGTLTDLRLAYVEASNTPDSPSGTNPAPDQASGPTPGAEPPKGSDDSRVKFSKKY